VIATLEVPFRDTTAADLGFRLTTEAVNPRPALACLELDFGAVRLELRILGGSHEARAYVAGVGLSEVVACDAPGADALPPSHAVPAAAGAYRFRSEAVALDPPALASAAERLAAQVGASPSGIVGRFPGHPAALTALLASPRADGVGWESWHLYPGAGELVWTTSVLRPAGRTPP
jgi:hypothetical protein